MYYSTHYKSPVGDILIASDENNIIGLWIGKQKYIANTMPKNIIEKDNLPYYKKVYHGWMIILQVTSRNYQSCLLLP